MVVTAMLVVACSSNKVGKPTSPVPDDPKLLSISKSWDTWVGFGASYRDYRWRPAQDKDAIYVATKQGEIYRVDKQTGSREAIADFAKEITGGLTLSGELLLFGNIDGELIAFNLATKKINWNVSFGSEILHTPTTDGKLVVAKTNNGQVWGVDLASGIILWTTITKNPPLTTRHQSSPVISGGVVFSTFDTGSIGIIDPQNGAKVWQATIGDATGSNDIQRLVDSDANPLIEPPYLFSVSLHGSLQAHQLVPGQPPELVWSNPFSSFNQIASDSDLLYLVDDLSVVYAFDKLEGSQVWKNDSLQLHRLASPVLYQNHLVIANNSGHLFVFDPADGGLLGVYRTSPYAVDAGIIFDQNHLYLLDNGGYLSAITISQL